MRRDSNDAGVVDFKEHQMLHALAVAIADHAARSEIELYAEQTTDVEGRRLFNTIQRREESVDEESLILVAKAARYIEMRGAALPYRLHRLDSYLWFEDPDTAVSLEDQLAG